MARLTRQHSLDNDDEDEIPPRSATSTRQSANRRRHNIASLSPSPAASFSSDKENHGRAARGARGSNGQTKEMAPPKLPTPPSAGESTHANKRRRLTERDAPNTSQIALQDGLQSIDEDDLYDPDQPMEERRTVRKGIRNLGRDLNGKAS